MTPFRKYKNKLLIKPAKDGLKALVHKTRDTIKGSNGQNAVTLIKKLNPILRGWANYHRHVCSGKTFWGLNRVINHQVLLWARRNHPKKSYGWLKQKYFNAGGVFGFSARVQTREGESRVLRLYSIAKTVIDRHIKVRGDANPYDPDYAEYFERRRGFAWRTLPCGKAVQVLPAGV